MFEIANQLLTFHWPYLAPQMNDIMFFFSNANNISFDPLVHGTHSWNIKLNTLKKIPY